MSENFDIVSFAVALAINLLLFGVPAALGVSAVFRLTENVSPRARYLIAVTVFLIAALVPFVVTLRGVFNPQIVAPSIAKSGQISKVDFREESIESEKLSSQTASTVIDIKKPSGALDDFVLYAANTQSAKGFFALWIFVSALLLFREFISHLLLGRMRRRLRPADISLRRELLCPDKIRLYVSESESPATVGLLRPVVIFPVQFPDDISRAMARSILRHETAHARWCDPLVNALLRIVRAIFWVSPALWHIERIVRDEQEAAADCAALATFSKSADADQAAADYVTSLLTVAKLSNRFSQENRFSAAATHFGDSSRLENRVRRLLAGYAKPSSARLTLAAAVILFVFLGMTFLPVASQPFHSNRRLLADGKSNHIFQRNNFAGQNLFADFENTFEGNESEKDLRNSVSAVAGKSKNKNFNDASESESNIAAQPTPPVSSEEKPGKSRRETEKNESGDDADLPSQASAVVKPSSANAPLSATPAEKPLVPRIPELPELKPVPELPILKLVVEPAQNPMPKR